MNIHTLAIEEAHLLRIVHNQAGTMEQKYRTLDHLGVFASYAAIQRAYVHLARTEHQLEAFKRAMFLQWYAWVEPACFTGIAFVDAASEQLLFEVFAEHIPQQTLDTECIAMLYWYYQVGKYYFQAVAPNALVQRIVHTQAIHVPINRAINQIDLVLRGQMGQYWASIIATKTC